MIKELTRSASIVLAYSLLTVPASANPFTWDGDGSPNTSVTTAANWVGDVAPDFDAGTDDITFDGSVNTSPRVRVGFAGDFNSDGVVDGADFIVWQGNPADNDGAAGLAAIKTNWGMTGAGAGDQVNGLTYAASAAAFTLQGAPGGFLAVAGPVQNNSANTQTINAKVRLQQSAVSAAAPMVFNGGVELTSPTNAATTFNNASDITINGSISSGASLSGATKLLKDGAGTLILNGASTFTGELRIGVSANASDSGAVRVTNSNALGDSSNTATGRTVIVGGGVAYQGNGRLELANDVSINESIDLRGRFSTFPSVESVSGNNTLNGQWVVNSGGGSYNFKADAGSTMNITQPFYTQQAGARWISMFGEGTINFSSVGSISTNLASIPDLRILNEGPGTLVLNGNDNKLISFIQAKAAGGTVKLGADFGNLGADPNYPLFSPTDDLNITSNLYVATPTSTIDVSALGTFTYNYDVTGAGGQYIGDFNVASGGYVSTGTSDGINYDIGVSTLNFHNNLNLSNDGGYHWGLGAESTSNPGVDFDQITVGGTLTLGGTSKLSVDFTDAGSDPDTGALFWTSAHSWKIIDTTGPAATTAFDSVVKLSDGTPATYAHGSFNTSIVGGDVMLNYVPSGAVAAVPEPGLLVLVGFAVMGLMTSARMRRKDC